ncbi:helix-turn-helix transcriptional regulator [Marinibaculum pumilum]|uniref:Helix-turn-helix transcriptional regulator n=1 Tax=Marinibaculum pumilum TaxID=1766165 RepID=A0ABV7L8N7_9PROT
MEDFASAAMMRLIRAGITRQGLQAPLPPAPAAARVPLAAKRTALDALLAAHGPLAILRIGEAAPHLPREPLHRALAMASDPADLLRRWSRLERYGHSRHQVRWSAEGPGRLHLQHRAMRGQPPHPAESLLVLGLLAVLAEMTGAEGVEMRAEAADGPRRSGGRWTIPDGAAPFDSCVLAFDPAPDRPLAFPAGRIGAGALVETLRQAVLADTARHWRLAELAAQTGRSPRSLQRHLQARGTSAAQVVTEARMEASAELLAGSGHSLAEIGFLCGFADQAHFGRSFKRFTALTPQAYRDEVRA